MMLPRAGPPGPPRAGFRDHDRDRDHGRSSRPGKLSGGSGSWKVKLRRLSGETLPGFPETFPLRGAFPALERRVVGSGAESCRCAERFPHIERQTLRAARSLRGNDGERSAIMFQRGTRRDHAAEREHAAITGQANRYHRNRARPAPQEPHRITLRDPAGEQPTRQNRTTRLQRAAACATSPRTTSPRTTSPRTTSPRAAGLRVCRPRRRLLWGLVG